tara:strand:- start:240 stop:368 length:129 start_codon:yes stop_codon:yes gene_type:complete
MKNNPRVMVNQELKKNLINYLETIKPKKREKQKIRVNKRNNG